MTIQADKTYAGVNNTSPHPAGYCVSYAPSDSAVFNRPSRWLMITDAAAKIINVRLAGIVVSTPAAIVGVSGDISMAANGVITSTTGGKFTSLLASDVVVLSGFTNPENNGTFKILTKTSATSLILATSGATVASYTIAETPTGANAKVQGPPTGVQHVVSFTANPGVMYPICADQLKAATTTAAGVLAFY